MAICVQEEERLLMKVKKGAYAKKKEKGKIPSQEEIKKGIQVLFLQEERTYE